MDTPTITVSLVESRDETHEADYFQVEDGWITLKTRAGTPVVSFPAARVTRVLTTMSPVAGQQQAILTGSSPEVTFEEMQKIAARVRSNNSLGTV